MFVKVVEQGIQEFLSGALHRLVPLAQQVRTGAGCIGRAKLVAIGVEDGQLAVKLPGQAVPVVHGLFVFGETIEPRQFFKVVGEAVVVGAVLARA